MRPQPADPDRLEAAELLAAAVSARGREVGLPFIAAAADIGSPHPLVDRTGRPLAETVFRWLDPDLRYWEDRAFALRAAFVRATRICSEPFFFQDGQFGSWRENSALAAMGEDGPIETFGVGAAIVAPAYLPGGVIGAVVWATPDTDLEVRAVFDGHAAALHVLALKFLSTYADAFGPARPSVAARLTRREIQCLKWAAAGKTDREISSIVGISLPTVRFHVTNATNKLGAAGRAQAILKAVALGYVGAEHAPRPRARAD